MTFYIARLVSLLIELDKMGTRRRSILYQGFLILSITSSENKLLLIVLLYLEHSILKLKLTLTNAKGLGKFIL